MESHDLERTQQEALDARLARLEGAFEVLARRVGALERTSSAAAAPAIAPAERGELGGAEPWIEPSRILRQTATVTFALLIALLLRTLTDAGTLARTPGIVLGIVYAGLLVTSGAWTLRRRTVGREVLPACGAILMCTVAIESHSRLCDLPLTIANALLLGTAIAASWLGLQYRAPALVEVAVLATALTSVALGFPVPHFPSVVGILLLGTAVAAALQRHRTRPWLQWAVLLVTLFFWLLWTVKLAAPLRRAASVPEEFYSTWFTPALAATLVVHLLVAGRRLARAPAAPGLFAQCLPAIAVGAAMAPAVTVVPSWLPYGTQIVGAAGLLLAAVLLALAPRLRCGTGQGVGAAGSIAFILASVVAMLPTIALLAANVGLAALAWSIIALLALSLSVRYASGGLRVLAHLAQAGAITSAAARGVFAVPPPRPVLTPALAAALAVFASLQYRRSRNTPPAPSSWYGALAPADPLRVLPLAGAIMAAFLGLRVSVYPAIAALASDPANVFRAAQSIALNAIALVLLAAAQRQRSGDLRVAAAVMAVVGGVRVFGSDLVSCRGVPLLVSVASFGIVALAASLLLGRRSSANQPSTDA